MDLLLKMLQQALASSKITLSAIISIKPPYHLILHSPTKLILLVLLVGLQCWMVLVGHSQLSTTPTWDTQTTMGIVESSDWKHKLLLNSTLCGFVIGRCFQYAGRPAV